MKSIKKISLIFSFALLLSACNQQTADEVQPATAVKTAIMDLSKYQLSGANVLAFGPDNVLFIGDSNGSKVHAVKTNATSLTDPVPYNMEGLDRQLAEKTGLAARDILIQDMKVHPSSQEAYISVKMGHQPNAKSVIVIASPTSPELKFLQLTTANSTMATINNPASSDLVFWNETPASSLTITDMDYYDGSLYIAGLTNGEFASNLRRIAYPFKNKQDATKRIEIYHAVHTQMETRAPIRTMLFDDLDGRSTLLASYTCTPLVTIPTAEITSNNSITGKTIAELGYGNTPIDMLLVTSQGFDGSLEKHFLITHKNRGASLIPYESVISAAKEKGMKGTRAMAPTGLKGMVEIPTAAVMQIDQQNQMMLAIVRRNIETGSIDLVSELTGSYLRLSDFISEYDFPGYRYPAEQAGTKKYHDMAKQMEGYPNLTSEKMNR